MQKKRFNTQERDKLGSVPDYPSTTFEKIRITKRDGWKLSGIYLNKANVSFRVATDHCCRKLSFISKGHRYFDSITDNVTVGYDKAPRVIDDVAKEGEVGASRDDLCIHC